MKYIILILVFIGCTDKREPADKREPCDDELYRLIKQKEYYNNQRDSLWKNHVYPITKQIDELLDKAGGGLTGDQKNP